MHSNIFKLFTSMLVLSLIMAGGAFNKSQVQVKNIISDQYQLSTPIIISGNANFTSIANSFLWPGNGSEQNPFIIDNLQIVGNENSTLLSIANTDLHFIISNSFFNGSLKGVYLNNATDGRLENNIFSFNEYGVFTVNSANYTFTGNTFFNNNYGVYYENSDNYIFMGNSFYDNLRGLNSYYSTGSIIKQNSFINNFQSIYFDREGGDSIVENIFDNDYYSIYLYRVTFFTNVSYNVIQNAYYGILGSLSIDYLVSNNVIHHSEYGHYSTSTSNIVVRNNILYSNNFGTFTTRGQNNSIRDNVAFNNSVGIGVDRQSIGFMAPSTNITKNLVYNNSDSGINLTFGTNAIVHDNTAFDNFNGIRLYFGSENNVTENNVFNNVYGIRLNSPEYPNIINNTLNNNGFFLEQYVDSLIYHNVKTLDSNLVNGKPVVYYNNTQNLNFMGNYYGQIILVNVTNVMINNVEINNASVGILLSHSSNISITNSDFAYNSEGIGIYDSKYVVVQNSKIFGGGVVGISLRDSMNVTLISSKIAYNGNGITDLRTVGLDIIDSSIHDNVFEGINLDSSANVSIMDNLIFGNGLNSKLLPLIIPPRFSLDSPIEELSALYNGITMNQITNLVLVFNLIADNLGFGLIWSVLGNSVLRDNDFIENNVNRDLIESESTPQVQANTLSGIGRNYYSSAVKDGEDLNNDGLIDAPQTAVIDLFGNTVDVEASTQYTTLKHYITKPKIIANILHGTPLGSILSIEWGGSIDTLGHSISYSVEASDGFLNGESIYENKGLPPGSVIVAIFDLKTNVVGVGVLAEGSEGLTAFDFLIENVKGLLGGPPTKPKDTPNGPDTTLSEDIAPTNSTGTGVNSTSRGLGFDTISAMLSIVMFSVFFYNVTRYRTRKELDT